MVTPLLSAIQTAGRYLATDHAVWRWRSYELPLEIQSFVSSHLPDMSYVTSVRGILLRDHEVLLLANGDGIQHVIPGGRIDPGESALETLKREIGEETGWTFVQPEMLGVMYLRHLAPCPPGYPYPHPEFLQVVYTLRAETCKPESKLDNDYEQAIRFVSIDEALALPIAEGQKAYLTHIRTGWR